MLNLMIEGLLSILFMDQGWIWAKLALKRFWLPDQATSAYPNQKIWMAFSLIPWKFGSRLFLYKDLFYGCLISADIQVLEPEHVIPQFHWNCLIIAIIVLNKLPKQIIIIIHHSIVSDSETCTVLALGPTLVLLRLHPRQPWIIVCVL